MTQLATQDIEMPPCPLSVRLMGIHALIAQANVRLAYADSVCDSESVSKELLELARLNRQRVYGGVVAE
jgi:hypothetical protein